MSFDNICKYLAAEYPEQFVRWLLATDATDIQLLPTELSKRNVAACVEVLASPRFDKNFIRQFLREELMRESPIYQEIIQEGVQRGKQDIVMRLLTRRFGPVSSQLQAQIQNLSIEQLDTLSELLLDFSDSTDLAVWLQSQQTIRN